MTYESSSPPLPRAELGPDSAAHRLAPQLAQFAAVARLEHVTQAAQLLGMPQPTLSRAVARLEGELGVRLLSRQGRTVRLHLTVPVDHRLAGRRRIRLAEVADEPFVAVEEGYGLRAITDGFCAEAGFVPRIAFEGEEAETLRGLVAAGLGVALLPPSLVPRPGVAELEVTAPRTRRAIGLAWVTGRPLTPPVAAFRDFVLSRRGRLLDHD